MINALLLTVLVLATIAVVGYVLLRAREGVLAWLANEEPSRPIPAFEALESLKSPHEINEWLKTETDKAYEKMLLHPYPSAEEGAILLVTQLERAANRRLRAIEQLDEGEWE